MPQDVRSTPHFTKIRFQLHAPLTHGAFGLGGGNAMPLRRFPVLTPDGVVDVPAVSGNSIRGQLRRIVMREILDRAGVNCENTPEHDWLYGALVNGGVLEGKQSARVQPDKIRDIRAAIPALSIFGAALTSHFLPGRMSVGIAWPICDVTKKASLVDEGIVPGLKKSAAVLESPPSLADIEGEVSHARLPDPEAQGISPMPYIHETLITGVWLESEIEFSPEATVLERHAVFHGIDQLDFLGGGAGRGMGRVKHEYAPALNSQTPDSAPESDHIDNAHENWLEENAKDGVAKFLELTKPAPSTATTSRRKKEPGA